MGKLSMNFLILLGLDLWILNTVKDKGLELIAIIGLLILCSIGIVRLLKFLNIKI
jgi:hypothetical protein